MKNHRLARVHPLHAVLVIVALTCAFASPVGADTTNRSPFVTAMTRNLYLGTGLTNLTSAKTFAELIKAADTDWANVVATDFPARAKALATEIQFTRPDVIGLQEVTLWRDQLVSDVVQLNLKPNAENVVYDFLATLQAELAARRMPYTAVSTSVNADAELPRSNPASSNGFTDVRMTDRDVILVRSGIASAFSNPQHGHYNAQLVVPTIGGPLSFTRGWTSIDYSLGGGRSARFFNTHLETEDAAAVQIAQGTEVLALINAAPYPTVVLGDFNSDAAGSTTATYANLTGGGLKDVWASQAWNPGRTCCQAEVLDRWSRPSVRIDLVLTKGAWRTVFAFRTGVWPFRFGPAPIMASDHFGVYAILALR